MANVVIKRCPVCPTIGNHAQQIVATMNQDLEMTIPIEDGFKGEFSVLVDGIPVIQRTGDSLPSAEEVEEAVLRTVPAGV